MFYSFLLQSYITVFLTLSISSMPFTKPELIKQKNLAKMHDFKIDEPQLNGFQSLINESKELKILNPRIKTILNLLFNLNRLENDIKIDFNDGMDSDEISGELSDEIDEQLLQQIVKKSWNSASSWKLPADVIRIYAQTLRKSSAPQKLYNELYEALHQ